MNFEKAIIKERKKLLAEIEKLGDTGYGDIGITREDWQKLKDNTFSSKENVCEKNETGVK